MMSGVALLLLALACSVIDAAPAPLYENSEEVVIPQKRAALVLDRILIALQKALHEPRTQSYDGPHAAPLRVPSYLESNDMSALQRRGQAGAASRGRVLRCYFNAVTCF
uniref:Allatostatin CC n=1 Tax=Grapholita molesta TaxID=192188 RepID=A0A7L9VV18_GRAMO|nr:allatostatin CC [Grapholita molesta]